MCADLWSFALSTYARPGVEQIYLRLQEQGANVCLLLCGAWLDQRGVRFEQSRVQALRQIADPWQADVVEPLRQVRKQWKAMARQDAELGVLRERVKTLELEAERQMLLRLETMALEWPTGDFSDQTKWLEELVAEATNIDRDALHQLCVAATGT